MSATPELTVPAPGAPPRAVPSARGEAASGALGWLAAQITGDGQQDRLAARVRNTGRPVTTATVVMSVCLLGTSFVTTA